MSLIFKALSDPTRRRVLEMLRQGPMSAGELAAQFSVSKPTMSAHFAVLREAGLIVSHKQAQTIVYHLQMSVLEDALFAFAQAFGLELRQTEAPNTKAHKAEKLSSPSKPEPFS